MGDVSPVYFFGLMAVLGLLPFFLMMVTSYVKIVVVTTLVRNALGVQQVPPAMVMNGLAIILSLFIMAPVGQQTWNLIKEQNLSKNPEPAQIVAAATAASPPLMGFLVRNTDPYVSESFLDVARRIWPPDMSAGTGPDDPIIAVPAFVVTELTEAFKVGFILYLPFIAIDLIVSNILLAMGMMMVSPMTISLPFKLLLFVTLEGWLKICRGLLFSYV
ncbi:MAG: type III secretion system export apparatus subunit SctR [Deltaproteobacteria bacterium]|jgi:type III secretion protein R|nr:type III secretion system export apparatus subunit SctR [Deltaproteobacteria bacterium]